MQRSNDPLEEHAWCSVRTSADGSGLGPGQQHGRPALVAVPKVIPELGSGTTVEFRFDDSAGKDRMEVQDKAFVAIDDSGDWQGASGCTTVAAVPVPTMADLGPGQSEIAATWTVGG